MKRAAVVLSLLALLGATPAAGSVRFGASEDAMEFAEDGGTALFGTMTDTGMSVDAVDVYWNPAEPTTIDNEAKLHTLLAAAQVAQSWRM